MLTTEKTTQIEKLATLLKNAHSVYAITGAGISMAAGIPDLPHLSKMADRTVSSETDLQRNPAKFYADFHELFIDPIFQNGPTMTHRVLARMEHDHRLKGIVTTNVDYLHELAGSLHVADVWGSLNVNHCPHCGRTYTLDALRASVPTCPNCGSVLEPDPVYHHIDIDSTAYAEANSWMTTADLVLTIGSNGYYDNIPRTATVVNINPRPNAFDQRAALTIRANADDVFGELRHVI